MTRYIKQCGYTILILSLVFLKCSNSRSQRSDTSAQSIVTGTWVVSEPLLSPLSIMPRCKYIQTGTIFIFSQDTLKIYTDASSNPCDVFRFMTTTNTITFIKEDMHFLGSYELNAGTLKIKAQHFLTYAKPDTSQTGNAPAAPELELVLIRKKK